MVFYGELKKHVPKRYNFNFDYGYQTPNILFVNKKALN